ncbi:meiotic recombination protein REC8 homolog isoform X3 [Denticeps clupeoides]|nr:meiotic recombination protein REC8 homolog isoform X3 [Denticeps clupeoides]XP_028831966.1 meiotic recombination protein REC8 homolog isoform X3 [Denticeps clupeoides]
MKRRDYLKVNVQRTCDDIMNYVLVRAPPPQAGLPRPRLSLYLSTQLQYGVVLVYHRQCEILLDEIQQIIDMLLRSQKKRTIDLVEDARATHTVPSGLSVQDETEGARDPFFGEMDFGDGLPSPTTLMEVSGPSEELPEPSSSDEFTASQESITLQEVQPVTIPQAEFEGAELLEFDMSDMLLEQPEHFPEEEGPRPRGGEPGDGDGDQIPEAADVHDEDLEVSKRSEGHDKTPSPTPPEPEPKRRERTDSPGIELVQEVLEVLETRGKKRRRLLIDEETQISTEDMSNRICDVERQTRHFVPVDHAEPPAAELLARPCLHLREPLRSLWRQGAATSPRPPGVGEPDAQLEVERWREQEKEGAEELDAEVLRELVESTLPQDISTPSAITLEASDRDISPLLLTPEILGPVLPKPIVNLEDIPEERADILEPEDPQRALLDPLQDQEAVTFHPLLPPLADRKTVACYFWELLEHVNARTLCVRQDEPYGDITITQGPLYRHTM